ncbi:MAG TPA: ABC transporter substrate-binding protein [Candidatus Kapabacteria bacterium]|nr:ABC transporter substrate-binding protein [Candidatus Kapabacteria bacterium]
MNRSPLFYIFAVLFTIGSLTSCKKEGGAVDNTGDIVVGEFASLTGQTATFGQSVTEGSHLAFDEINEAGGVLDRKIKVVTEDDQSKTEDANAAVQKLISRDNVIALLGEVASSRSMAAAPTAQNAKIPMISPASTNEEVTKKGDYIFRICFIDPFQGEALANFALKSLNAKRAAVLQDVRQDYSLGLAEAFKRTFLAGGGQIVSEQSYSSSDKEFRAQLTSVRSSQPDVIFVPGYYNEVSLIVRQARELGLTVPLLGGDGWDSPELTKGAEKEFENTYLSNHFAAEDPDPIVQGFVTKYKQKYGKSPDAMAALGYDAARILADAIKRAGTTEGPKLRDAIAQTKDFLGVTGKITINAQRNADKPLTILKVVNGQFKFHQRVDPSGATSGSTAAPAPDSSAAATPDTTKKNVTAPAGAK